MALETTFEGKFGGDECIMSRICKGRNLANFVLLPVYLPKIKALKKVIFIFFCCKVQFIVHDFWSDF